MSFSFAPRYAYPGIYKKSADAAKNTKFRVVIDHGKVTIETIANPSNPGGCDKAQVKCEQILGLEDQALTVTKHHPVEEKMLAPIVEPEPMVEKEIEKA